VLRYGAFLALILSAGRLEAQSRVDSLAALLDSPDWRVRAGATFALYFDRDAQIPARYGPQLAALFEREALASNDRPEGSESYGEYLLQLTDVVLRLRDPASLRGMALLGIQTSVAAKQFVAQQGSTSLGYLDEAWATERTARSSVMATWGIMLQQFNGLLSREQRLLVLSRLLSGADSEPVGFARAAETVPLLEAIPLLEQTAASTTFDIVRQRALDVASVLRPVRGTATTATLLDRLGDWLGAVCLGAARARQGACEALTNILADASQHAAAGRTLPARNALSAFANRTEAAFREGAFTALERDLLAGSARYIAQRF